MKEYIQKFIKSIEEYYTEYANDTVRIVIAKYLMQFSPDQLKELFDLITDDFSNTYKMPPDKNRFVEAWKKKFKQAGLKKVGDHYEDQLGNVFDRNMEKIGHFDNGRFIPNLANAEIREKILELGDSDLSPDRYLECRKALEANAIIKRD